MAKQNTSPLSSHFYEKTDMKVDIKKKMILIVGTIISKLMRLCTPDLDRHTQPEHKDTCKAHEAQMFSSCGQRRRPHQILTLFHKILRI